MANLFVKIVTLAIAISIFVTSVNANSSNDDYYGGEAVSLNQLGGFFVDSVDIANELHSYEKLWIQVTKHSCVWTECSVDETDDAYQGDNRDGDEQWYQYRTQGFCANAAYSLYGQKKADNSFLSAWSGRRCSRRHFIHSFFTYGGADNLLSSLGVDPVVYYHNQDGDDENNDDYDWSSVSTTANAVCVEIDNYVVEGKEYDDESADEFDDDDEEEEEEDRQRQRHLSSDSNDNDAFGGSLGCNVDGTYVIAAFQSSSCDGNYFAGIVDAFEDYNEQHNGIGCHTLYEDGDDEMSVDHVYLLLNNSWSCDLRLYPNGCPDPYGILEKYDHALRTVAHGGNAHRAYQNMRFRTPCSIISWCLLAVTVVIFGVTYLVHNAARAMDSKGGNNVQGYLRCLGEDIPMACGCLCACIAMQGTACVVGWTSKKNQVRAHFFHQDGTWKQKGDDNDDDNNDDGGDEERPSYTKMKTFVVWLTSKKNQMRAHFFHTDGTWKKQKGDDNDNDENNDDGVGDEEQRPSSYTQMKMLSSPDREESVQDKDRDLPAPPLVWWKKALTILAVIGSVGLISAGAGMLVYWILLLLLRVAGLPQL